MVSVHSYANSRDVADAVARYVIKHQNDALEKGHKFKIAISGGSLGKVLNEGLIANKENFANVKWSNWEVYFSDERLVPLNHEDSNYGLFNEMVLKSLRQRSVELPKVITIDESLLAADGSTDDKIASDYEAKLPESLDLILLGCGPDGHTCSLFPGHKLLSEKRRRIAFLQDSPKPPPRRVTFTFPVLFNSKNIAFVAEGAGKAAVLSQIFEEKDSGLPCELVNKGPVPVTWFVNDPAIQGVPVAATKY
ncbi:hypothetical protein KL925_002685 [Ogataea polymorpha]|uniref:6-phosphogluconolactonase-like protein n=1 Tax=Ogataea polymorpha TaxID=460523 RepID=A0A1B7SP89_9ASCO|nr:uncharacterized protein OGAPODRAFT_91784 [Ogataea polymorpha]KAG7880681.1 hypothetical protein KL937_002243 [Ogataea polymorpha]KAG7889479.1 hypothetical protein KL936_003053 [Ogataea polymorpha]KAG7894488.1 hypothetical protein KL908_001860 [Ogataea polymorpha]KAG7899920.1 hypothetical protein KL935_003461 [Ogataea polymorpha]KAG7906759.1 hypothetical protein KL907_002399 [Ogataea polymorpha]